MARCGPALLVATLALPGQAPGQAAPDTAHASADAAACADLIADGIAAARRDDLAAAERLLAAARSRCRDLVAVDRELAGLRFRQRRYAEAAQLAERVLVLLPADAYAWEIVASSRFLLDDAAGALRAWNRLGRPVNRQTRVTGAHRTPEHTLAAAIGFSAGELITPRKLARARRRLADLPAVRSERVEYLPVADGEAEVHAAVAEHASLPRGWPDLVRHGLRAALDTRLQLDVAGPLGVGEVWTAQWSWLRHRRAAELGLAATGVPGIPGVLGLRAERRSSAYRLPVAGGADSTTLRETRRAVGLSVSDWASGIVLWMAGASLEHWHDRGSFVGLATAVELRAEDDRAALRADASGWWSAARGETFNTARIEVATRSSPATLGLEWTARAGLALAGESTPADLWPAAGSGRAVGPLLRAHPLLDADGVAAGHFVAPALGHASAELRRWSTELGPVRLGVAIFVDAAVAGGRSDGGGMHAAVDAGAGMRVHVPLAGAIRTDLARGLVDGATAFSIGWIPAWPGWW